TARIRESYWHPTQRLEDLPGGGVRLEVALPSLLEFTPWVLSWGAAATVIEPPALRQSVAAALREAASNYS
ncbi:MAG TPA: WYL domain-containing protein, partial [Tepidiformaceae bacterium]|nr:WYL domain-containing protein [Tepidiformaceae bacterium]